MPGCPEISAIRILNPWKSDRSSDLEEEKSLRLFEFDGFNPMEFDGFRKVAGVMYYLTAETASRDMLW
jgi:hypothetical protein